MIRAAFLRFAKPLFWLLFALLGAALAALQPARADTRLQERLYQPDEVVIIRGKPKVQATIAFGEGEEIENVAVGDSNAWQVTPNKRANLLFVKPLEATAKTNMTVVTNKHTYLFDLIANPRNKPVYVLKFLYPEPEVDPEEEARAKANALELEAANDPYAVVDPAQLNFGWIPDGDTALLPEQTYDNGDAVFLIWPEDRSVPAILTRDIDGTEGPVNFTVRGETVVVQSVPPVIILRSGDESATLTHQAPDPERDREKEAD